MIGCQNRDDRIEIVFRRKKGERAYKKLPNVSLGFDEYPFYSKGVSRRLLKYIYSYIAPISFSLALQDNTNRLEQYIHYNSYISSSPSPPMF